MATFQRIGSKITSTSSSASTSTAPHHAIIGATTAAAATVTAVATFSTAGRYTSAKTTSHCSNVASKYIQNALFANRNRARARYYHSNSTGSSRRNYNDSTIMQSLLNRANKYQHQQRRFKADSTATAPTNVHKAATTTNATGSNNTTTGTSSSFLQWYEGHLESQPVATKMVTGSILWGLGDAVAQIVPTLFFNDDTTTTTSSSSSSSSISSDSDGKNDTSSLLSDKLAKISYDYPRTGRAMLFGFAVHAPLSHVHFNFLEWMTIKGGFTGLNVAVFKAFMEQFVYWSWFSNSLYHGAMGAMTGMTPTQVYDRISDVLWETQKAQWVFWIPVQLLNFRFVPVRHQLNVVLMTSVVWTALLSAWYPPQDDDDDDVEEEKKESKQLQLEQGN